MINQQQVEETIKRYMELEQNAKSKTVLEIMTSREFCHKKPNPKFAKLLSKKIKNRTKTNEPIIFNILFGPRKNPNSTNFNYAEWAELFTLCQLARLYHRVKSVYEPSLKIRIFCDDARAIAVNNYNPKSTEDYIQSLRELIRNTGLDKIIKVIKFNEIYDQYRVVDYLTKAEERIKKWESDERNKEKTEEMDEHCRKNILLSGSFQEIKKKIEESSHLYRVYLEAERLAGIYDILDIWATYREEPNFLFIYSLCKGNITQPWQGECCLKILSSGKTIPYVITQERKDNTKTVMEFYISLSEVPTYLRRIKLVN